MILGNLNTHLITGAGKSCKTRCTVRGCLPNVSTALIALDDLQKSQQQRFQVLLEMSACSQYTPKLMSLWLHSKDLTRVASSSLHWERGFVPNVQLSAPLPISGTFDDYEDMQAGFSIVRNDIQTGATENSGYVLTNRQGDYASIWPATHHACGFPESIVDEGETLHDYSNAKTGLQTLPWHPSYWLKAPVPTYDNQEVNMIDTYEDNIIHGCGDGGCATTSAFLFANTNSLPAHTHGNTLHISAWNVPSAWNDPSAWNVP
ncbi:hypothetical protein CEUSTIGMA_g11595.t1 [Chlamydomonas eustigma]|uniref:Uncharacterized protein n=1 Tax=Chlamydomonas eustigma TaxID=1157962 RepID=A0A250XMP8_9CHLO|nr:hypothetical protein CEUSTIGMA_g11595.t1 [Chlamydomonas eustigma]|eukprot:GAX84172.1 hypothetical protein CEUSTIGMA_g11595.t1 [Chlamydomonas eustigma]